MWCVWFACNQRSWLASLWSISLSLGPTPETFKNLWRGHAACRVTHTGRLCTCVCMYVCAQLNCELMKSKKTDISSILFPLLKPLLGAHNPPDPIKTLINCYFSYCLLTSLPIFRGVEWLQQKHWIFHYMGRTCMCKRSPDSLECGQNCSYTDKSLFAQLS